MATIQRKDLEIKNPEIKKLSEIQVEAPTIDVKKAQFDEDHEMVTGVFKYFDIPGGTLAFSFRKYKEPIKHYSMVDGRQYTVPRMVADHLNDNCCHPQYGWTNDEFGADTQKIVTYEHRTGFFSRDFRTPTQPSLIRAELR